MSSAPFETVIAAVNADIAASITAVNGDVPTFHTGPEFLNQQESPPRIVWIPVEDTMRETIGVGGRHLGTSPPGFYPGRSVCTSFDGLEVHVWGRDYGETDALKRQLILSVHRLLVGSRELVGTTAKWNNESLDVRYGREWVWTFQFHIPVIDAPYAYAPNAVLPQITGTMQIGDAPEEVGCSGS